MLILERRDFFSGSENGPPIVKNTITDCTNKRADVHHEYVK